ncbi:MAG: porphobilinogen synthase [Nitrospiraceae bacterium]|nr:porphobilinogen synthase [Nitrospiraceae bacterium]
MGFPAQRLRRLRKSGNMRRMVRETGVAVSDLVQPLFVVEGKGIRREIPSIAGNYHLSVDMLVEEAGELSDLGIPAVLLFGIPHGKDERAAGAYAPDGIVQRAVRAIRGVVPDMVIITDVCLCEHTPHGHCGIISNGYIVNDSTTEIVAKIALSHVEAGADVVAPAGMMDGQIRAIRNTLEEHGRHEAVIMAYAAKYASGLYEPFFRHGTQSPVAFGDKKSHQMDFANSNEAMREIALDIEEGADIIMIKPALFYLDVVYRARQRFDLPLAVYNVSGEYAMVRAAAEAGRLDFEAVMQEALVACKRAGANLIISYYAKDAARTLNKQSYSRRAAHPIQAPEADVPSVDGNGSGISRSDAEVRK